MTEDEMVGWHHQFKGHEFEQAPGVERRGSLACCSPWGHKESDMPEQLKNKNKCSTGANKWFGRALCMPCMPYRCMTYVGKKKKTTNVFAMQSTSFLVPSLPAPPIK